MVDESEEDSGVFLFSDESEEDSGFLNQLHSAYFDDGPVHAFFYIFLTGALFFTVGAMSIEFVKKKFCAKAKAEAETQSQTKPAEVAAGSNLGKTESPRDPGPRSKAVQFNTESEVIIFDVPDGDSDASGYDSGSGSEGDSAAAGTITGRGRNRRQNSLDVLPGNADITTTNLNTGDDFEISSSGSAKPLLVETEGALKADASSAAAGPVNESTTTKSTVVTVTNTTTTVTKIMINTKKNGSSKSNSGSGTGRNSKGSDSGSGTGRNSKGTNNSTKLLLNGSVDNETSTINLNGTMGLSHNNNTSLSEILSLSLNMTNVTDLNRSNQSQNSDTSYYCCAETSDLSTLLSVLGLSLICCGVSCCVSILYWKLHQEELRINQDAALEAESDLTNSDSDSDSDHSDENLAIVIPVDVPDHTDDQYVALNLELSPAKEAEKEDENYINGARNLGYGMTTVTTTKASNFRPGTTAASTHGKFDKGKSLKKEQTSKTKNKKTSVTELRKMAPMKAKSLNKSLDQGKSMKRFKTKQAFSNTTAKGGMKNNLNDLNLGVGKH